MKRRTASSIELHECVEWSAPDGRLPLQTTTLPPSSLGGTEAKFGGANSSSIELGVKTRKVVARVAALASSLVLTLSLLPKQSHFLERSLLLNHHTLKRDPHVSSLTHVPKRRLTSS
ncbi:unnamed protein product [Microthlaspi erraticum]|uniref:Uncharacterized protein n=1 Tax=Microthlaspi erraticum TaxID=1685480 RepID=A0A6D2LJ93_9BRAS|nr:unnamed protein product [Microthlaspi erraticum]